MDHSAYGFEMNPLSGRYPPPRALVVTARRMVARARARRLRNYLSGLTAQPLWTLRQMMLVRLLALDGEACHLCTAPLGANPCIDVDGALAPVMRSTRPWSECSPTLDHLIPRSWGEASQFTEDNLRVAHRWCNGARGDAPVGTTIEAPAWVTAMSITQRPLRYSWSAHNAVIEAARPARVLLHTERGMLTPMTHVLRGPAGDRLVDVMLHGIRRSSPRHWAFAEPSTAAVCAAALARVAPEEAQFGDALIVALEKHRAILTSALTRALAREAQMNLGTGHLRLAM